MTTLRPLEARTPFGTAPSAARVPAASTKKLDSNREHVGAVSQVPCRLISRLRDVREETGLSVQMLAEASGVGAKTILLCEGGRNEPTLVTALLLAEALEVEVEDLFQRRRSS